MKKWRPDALILMGIFSVVGYGVAQTWTVSTPNLYDLRNGCTAMSADGKLIVASGSVSPSTVISTNYGATWSNIGNVITYWRAMASSADGTKLVSASMSPNTSTILLSTNSGVTWSTTVTPSTYWSGVASSADGSRLYAAVQGGQIYCSSNSGVGWHVNDSPSTSWTSLATSADGTKVFAASATLVYGSTNSGVTWTSMNAPSNTWSSICASADGTFIAAAGNACYLSTNSGVSWTPTGQSFNLVACSADGSKLIACTGNSTTLTSGSIFISTNWGTTWISNSPPTNVWSYVGCSADGNQFVAAGGGEFQTYFWVLKETPTPQLIISPSSTNLSLSWLVPSTNFLVQESADLVSWTNLAAVPLLNLTNLNEQLTLSPTNNGAFYRLSAQ